MVVVTLSGVPSVGGSVTCGRTGWILAVTKTSLTREVMMELLPTPSSPQRHMRTAGTRQCTYVLSGRNSTYRSPFPSRMLLHVRTVGVGIGVGGCSGARLRGLAKAGGEYRVELWMVVHVQRAGRQGPVLSKGLAHVGDDRSFPASAPRKSGRWVRSSGSNACAAV
jgi:hypothetical protein